MPTTNLITISNFAYASSDGTDSMPTSGGHYVPASDGYVGTLSYGYSNTNLVPVAYYLIYDVTYYDASGSTDDTSKGTVSRTAPANSSGNLSLNFHATTPGMSSGEYQINVGAYYKNGDGTVGDLITYMLTPDYSHGRPFIITPPTSPLPTPKAPSPGKWPGNTPPPTSGPVGPGTS